MKAKSIRQPTIHVAIAEDDPLRLIGFCALLEAEPDLELHPIRLAETRADFQADVVLLTERAGYSLADAVDTAKAALPGARVLATGSTPDEDVILHAISLGARGYISESASSAEFARAIRIVNQGSIWAPRGVVATLIERAADYFPGSRFTGRATLTDRQKEVLKMLVAGRSNKEIAVPLGIEERTVKSHIAQLMRKLGVSSRIALSVQAITHSIVRCD
jgi:DNA-binding NarL/FixJ family response regulator